ncbi:DNA primase large subunit Spp2 [Basidiobolus ranarum]|uniref:DNA primase large subunit Spp2 n=1 Tax=Basidiobolus ranarum TaxID=34480 RepID=A0ABR2X0J9_9FUNG
MFKLQLKGKGRQEESTSNSEPKKFGFSFSKTKPKPKPKLSQTLAKGAFGEETDKRKRDENEIEYVTGLEENEITSLNPKKNGPLVIPSLKNTDLRQTKKKAHYIPEKEQETSKSVEPTILNNKPLTYGLQIQTKTAVKEIKTETNESIGESSTLTNTSVTSTTIEETVTVNANPEESLTSQAIKELTRGATSDDDDTNSSQRKVLPAVGANEMLNEGELYKQDVESRPRECTLEEYEEVPVEEFGAALLRGMGWKDGQIIGKSGKNGLLKPVDFAARPNLLGLGARPKPPGLDEKKPRRRVN